jgi:hypothetical protein
MKIRATVLRTADKVEVSDGHPRNSGGHTFTYLRIDGVWLEDGDAEEDPMTDSELNTCWDVLRAWSGGRLILDRYEELTTQWNREAGLA